MNPQKPLKKVFLVVPPTGKYIREDRCQTPLDHMKTVALRPPIDLMYAAACFEQGGAECRLADYPAEGRDAAQFENDLLNYQPDLVLFSITTPSLEEDMSVAGLAKHALGTVITAAKGAHFNTLDREALRRHSGLDLALRGEFEPACRALAEGKPWKDIPGLTFRDASGQIIRTADPGFVEDLDQIPFPARHLTDNRLYVRPDTGAPQTTLVTNRGCPFSCIYCLANQVGGRRNRTRSVGNIIAEIRECVEKHGIRNFLFRSDLFTANRDWVLELCGQIQSHGLDIAWACNSRVDTLDPALLAEMKKAHCWMIAFGVESGSEEMLGKIGKKADLAAARRALEWTRQAGILSSVYFMMGLPWDTTETLASNIDFAREIDPDFLEIFYVYPFPGTPLYDEAVRLGLLRQGEIPRQAYDQPAMAGLYLSKQQLAAARNEALRRFYLRPRIIWRTLQRAQTWREKANYLRYGWQQLKDFL